MQIEVLASKIHRASVTASDLNYIGSITIDSELIAAAGLFEYQKVDILNINNGARFTTYVIRGDKSGEICINGAAARLVQKGDLIIIAAYGLIDAKSASTHAPKIVHVDSSNKIIKES